MDYSDDTAGRLFVFCLNLLEKEERFHRLISVIVETWKYFKHFPISTNCTLITSPLTQLLILDLWFLHIMLIFLMEWDSDQIIYSEVWVELFLRNMVALRWKLEDLPFWTHPLTWNVIHFIQKKYSLSSIFPEEYVWSACLSSKRKKNLQYAWHLGEGTVTWCEVKGFIVKVLKQNQHTKWWEIQCGG